jgi:hypothetical protein
MSLVVFGMSQSPKGVLAQTDSRPCESWAFLIIQEKHYLLVDSQELSSLLEKRLQKEQGSLKKRIKISSEHGAACQSYQIRLITVHNVVAGLAFAIVYHHPNVHDLNGFDITW